MTELDPRERSRSERVAAAVGRPRTVLLVLLAALAWVALDHALAAGHAPRLDPFPHRWLQRGTLLVALATLLVCARARRLRNAREKRLRRQLRAQQLQLMVSLHLRAPGPRDGADASELH